MEDGGGPEGGTHAWRRTVRSCSGEASVGALPAPSVGKPICCASVCVRAFVWARFTSLRAIMVMARRERGGGRHHRLTHPPTYIAVDGEVEGGGDGAVVGAAQAVAHLVGQELQLVAHVGEGVEEDAVGVGRDALAVALLVQLVRRAQPFFLLVSCACRVVCVVSGQEACAWRDADLSDPHPLAFVAPPHRGVVPRVLAPAPAEGRREGDGALGEVRKDVAGPHL